MIRLSFVRVLRSTLVTAALATALGGSPAHAALGGASGIVIPYAGKLELNGALVTGNIDFRFDVMTDATTTTVCESKTIAAVPVTNGEFAVTIPAINEACVKGQDVHLQIAVKQAGGTFVVLGKQRVTPVVGAVTSGPGDFAVTGALTANTVAASGAVTANSVTATGAVTASTATVTGALSAGPTTVTGDLVVTGTTSVGLRNKACQVAFSCSCDPGFVAITGGVLCDAPKKVTATFPFFGGWAGTCDGAAADQLAILCARLGP